MRSFRLILDLSLDQCSQTLTGAANQRSRLGTYLRPPLPRPAVAAVPSSFEEGSLSASSCIGNDMSGQLVHNISALKQRRRDLRQNLTTAEALLWKNLQRSRLDGKKFRRQHSVGKYILDFYCPECRLAVELDGEAHFTSIRAKYDVARDEFIRSLKIRTVRFENRLVFENLESVLETIKEHLK